MEDIKRLLLHIIANHNQGGPVSYPVIDRKAMRHYPTLIKEGKLGAILDELVAEKLITQVGPSVYQGNEVRSPE